MSFEWHKYVDLADHLSKQTQTGFEEAHFRSAISRAYYGVFCLSRDKAGLEKSSTRNVHQEVISVYRDSNDMSKKKLGRTLDELRRYRNKADYDGNSVIKIEDAERALEMANEILSVLPAI